MELFSRTLKLESHFLHQRPDLIWQQLYNRLQWAAAPRDWMRFVREQSHILREHPRLHIHQAAKQPDSTAPTIAAKHLSTLER